MKYRSRIYYSAEQKNLMWDRWHTAATAQSLTTGTDISGTRRDFPWHGRRPVASTHCIIAGSSTVDGES